MKKLLLLVAVVALGWTTTALWSVDGAADLWQQVEAPLVAPADSGIVYGNAFGEVVNDEGRSAMTPMTSLRVEMLGPERVIKVARADATGRYRFDGLPAGRYQVRATDAHGRSHEETVEVAKGVATRLNWLVDARKKDGLFPSYAAVAVDRDGESPDINGDGFVGQYDLDFVSANRGLEGDGYSGDFDRNGRIDDRDIAALRAVFGRAVIRVPATIQAQVTPGGSFATLGDGASVLSGHGYTKGVLTRTADPKVVRFTVSEDRGDASSPELGEFRFRENPENPTWIEVSLDTGLVLDGQMTLLFDDAPFGARASAKAEIGGGAIALAAGGFCAYRVVEVEGVVSAELSPLIEATTAFVMGKGDDKKEDKACGTVAAPVGDPMCNLGGTKCANNGAECASGGSCGFCSDVTAGGVGGTSCQGCACW
ncbi:MAG: carboxypeptidase regulatory-like domain-containing protein [Acidobacteriota bacterium]